jgi:hypothetical protein
MNTGCVASICVYMVCVAFKNVIYYNEVDVLTKI